MDKASFYGESREDLTGPLHGVRVLDVTTTWAGPMAGCVLADLGADVIKVESLSGEISRRLPPFLPGTNPALSFAHATVNRNKRSLTLELGSRQGREIFMKLAARADIVIESFKPGTMDKWGLGYKAVSKVKPDIVYISVSGWGQWGPDHDRPGYDPAAQAASGFVSLNGTPDGTPVKAPTFLCDDLAGLHAAIGAMAALRHRDRTGEGQHVDVALLDAMLFQSNGYLTLAAMGAPMARWGNDFIFAVPASVYRCSDGYVYAGALLDAHWKVIARMAGRPELAYDPEYATLHARLRHRNECDELLAGWCSERTVAKAIAECTHEGITCAPVRSYAEAARSPHVIERDMLQATRLEDGTVAPITGPAAKFSRTPTRIRFGAAALGAHNDEILDEIGIDTQARRRLRKRKVI